MKKLIMLTLVLLVLICNSHAQTWAEWFKQKKTQRKYLIEQIAAMQLYLDYTRKGYSLVKEGTSLIGDIKNGDFNLHNQYFNSLKTVDPAISNSGPAQEILKMHNAMIRSRVAILKLVDQSKVFNAGEVKSIKQVYANLEEEANKDVEELKLLTENGKLELSDDQRIERIDKVFKRMKQKYGFQLQTDRKIKGLAESRKADLRHAETLKKLYGL